MSPSELQTAATVAGVAVSDEFKLTPDAGEAAVLTAALVE